MTISVEHPPAMPVDVELKECPCGNRVRELATCEACGDTVYCKRCMVEVDDLFAVKRNEHPYRMEVCPPCAELHSEYVEGRQMLLKVTEKVHHAITEPDGGFSKGDDLK